MFSNGLLHCIYPGCPFPTTERFGATQEDSLGLNGVGGEESKGAEAERLQKRGDTQSVTLSSSSNLR